MRARFPSLAGTAVDQISMIDFSGFFALLGDLFFTLLDRGIDRLRGVIR